MEHQLVVFELANEHYAFDIATIDGIIKLQQITKLPHTPAFVEGVTNLRGTVVPVIDLRKRFGLAQAPASRETRIVVAYIDDTKVGMIVDAVSQVLRVPDDAIEPPPPMATTVNSQFIKGIAKLDAQLVILLELGKVLSLNEKESIFEVAAAA